MTEIILQSLVHGIMTSVETSYSHVIEIEKRVGDNLRKQVSEKSTVIATSLELQHIWEKKMTTCSIQGDYAECKLKGVHYHLYSYCDGWIEG